VRLILLSIVSLVIIGAFAVYVYRNADQLRELLQVSAAGLAIMFALCLAFPLLGGLQNAYLYRSLGADVSNQDGFYLTAISTLANQLPISGGIISKGLYLKTQHNLSYTRFLSSTVALFACFVAVGGVIGTGVLTYWLVLHRTQAPSILWFAFGIMACGILIFWLPLDRIRGPAKIRSRIHQAAEGWGLISGNRLLLLRLVALQGVLIFLLAVRYWLAFRMLSQNVSLSQTLLFASASILTQLVSIAPGGLGVREGIVAAVAAALGFDPGASVVAVGLDRLVATAAVLLTGAVSTWMLGKRITETGIRPDAES
jgi:uncharacterized membrane protein YbhN (UPF0104 family)